MLYSVSSPRDWANIGYVESGKESLAPESNGASTAAGMPSASRYAQSRPAASLHAMVLSSRPQAPERKRPGGEQQQHTDRREQDSYTPTETAEASHQVDP